MTLIQSRLGTGGVRFDSGPGELHERCLETNPEYDVHDRHEYVRRLDAGEFRPPTATLRINGSGNFQTRWTTTIEGPCDDVVLLDGNEIVHRRSAKADGDNINNTSESKGFGYRAAYLDRFGNVLDFSPVYVPKTPEVWLSGTMLRDRAQHGRSLRFLVPDAVWTYLAEHGLYTGTTNPGA